MNERPAITQKMIRLYDEYTHLTLDRRGFMKKLAKLTGSAAAAAAVVPFIAANQAHAAVVPPDDPRLATQPIEYPGENSVMKAYLARPAEASGALPAVIVIHENRGLNAHIEDVARRVALEGFLALAPDFLSPVGGTPFDEDEARKRFEEIDAAATVRNAVASVQFLKKDVRSTGKIGAVGFCWGGGLVNNLAIASPDLAAAVAYYGGQPKEGIERIKAKLMLHYAGLDDRIDAGIPDFEKALKAAGIDYQLFMYAGANHAFSNDTSEARYDKQAADLAWSRTIAFLKQVLA